MLSVDPYLLLLLIGSLYIVVFGGLSLLRREGLSVQFALESIALIVIMAGGSWLLQIQLSPFVFLIVLYLVTMRSRLAVEVANLLVGRGSYDLPFRLYGLALSWWPDPASRLIVLTNRGAAELRSGQTEKAIHTLEGVLESESQAKLGLKYEAACRYNLGYAYEKNGQDAKAVAQYNEAIDVLPGSLYAQAAQAALKRRKRERSGD
jgi:tetratricopeptide (TPR) repeat protein